MENIIDIRDELLSSPLMFDSKAFDLDIYFLLEVLSSKSLSHKDIKEICYARSYITELFVSSYKGKFNNEILESYKEKVSSNVSFLSNDDKEILDFLKFIINSIDWLINSPNKTNSKPIITFEVIEAELFKLLKIVEEINFISKKATKVYNRIVRNFITFRYVLKYSSTTNKRYYVISFGEVLSSFKIRGVSDIYTCILNCLCSEIYSPDYPKDDRYTNFRVEKFFEFKKIDTFIKSFNHVSKKDIGFLITALLSQSIFIVAGLEFYIICAGQEKCQESLDTILNFLSINTERYIECGIAYYILRTKMDTVII